MVQKIDDNAAHNLENRTLKNGWYVKSKVKRNENSTGSNFSVGYIVEKNEKKAFMKAYDIAGFLNVAPLQDDGTEADIMDVMQNMTTAYLYERDLSKLCKDKRVTKVSFVIDAGQENIPGYMITIVPYLIFDLASGDIRKNLDFSIALDYAWRFKSLHDIAVGIKQLHSIDISHQDLKPSNILVFDSESKICDLGRSVCKDIDGPYSKLLFTGDRNYAPPEMWYRYYEQDWRKRVFAIDCYMLGSLVVFYFSGLSMSALLNKYIPDEFQWTRWKGSFEEIIPYLENAFSSSLNEFELNINDDDMKKELRQLVEYLCNPFPDKRGHIKNIQQNGNSYSMERFISKLEFLKRKAELKVKSIKNG